MHHCRMTMPVCITVQVESLKRNYWGSFVSWLMRAWHQQGHQLAACSKLNGAHGCRTVSLWVEQHSHDCCVSWRSSNKRLRLRVGDLAFPHKLHNSVFYCLPCYRISIWWHSTCWVPAGLRFRPYQRVKVWYSESCCPLTSFKRLSNSLVTATTHCDVQLLCV